MPLKVQCIETIIQSGASPLSQWVSDKEANALADRLDAIGCLAGATQQVANGRFDEAEFSIAEALKRIKKLKNKHNTKLAAVLVVASIALLGGGCATRVNCFQVDPDGSPHYRVVKVDPWSGQPSKN